MATLALRADYQGDRKDAADKFGGAILVYINWERHLFFYSAKAFPLDPNMPFAAVLEHVIGTHFCQHPEYKNIDWGTAEWSLNNEPFQPVMDKSLAENGFDHKCLLRFKTAEKSAFADAGV